MKAALLENLNKPLVIETEIEIPSLKKGQVLVKLAYSGVCHSQLMEAEGKRGVDNYLPHMLGHEGSGVVIEIGEDVTKVKSGDKVILGWIKGTGIDAGGTIYCQGDKKINAGAVTTFSEYSVVSENRCTQLPEGIPMDIAVLFGCAVPTGAGIVTNMLQPETDSTIAVFGLGGIGMSALMAIQLYQCKCVIAIDVNDDKLNLAKSFGATDVINSSEVDSVKAVMDLTNNLGVDYSVEAAGHAHTIEQAFSSVRAKGGLCVFASHPASGQKISIDPYDLILGKQIKGSWGGDSNPDRDIPLLANLYRNGKLPLEKLITNRYKLDNINDA
ncbi:zinc-binding dehydrogenase, partial [Oceanospirillaceae bacterium]|nr:zinc-binding dehydrogenase [Oceanospirillaceae bacterium]